MFIEVSSNNILSIFLFLPTMLLLSPQLLRYNGMISVVKDAQSISVSEELFTIMQEVIRNTN